MIDELCGFAIQIGQKFPGSACRPVERPDGVGLEFPSPQETDVTFLIDQFFRFAGEGDLESFHSFRGLTFKEEPIVLPFSRRLRIGLPGLHVVAEGIGQRIHCIRRIAIHLEFELHSNCAAERHGLLRRHGGAMQKTLFAFRREVEQLPIRIPTGSLSFLKSTKSRPEERRRFRMSTAFSGMRSSAKEAMPTASRFSADFAGSQPEMPSRWRT